MLPELAKLEGQWETYGFYLIDKILLEKDNVFETGISSEVNNIRGSVLVIVGSDLLGTIYGMFHLSELLGVSAANFWGDVKPAQFFKNCVEYRSDRHRSDKR